MQYQAKLLANMDKVIANRLNSLNQRKRNCKRYNEKFFTFGNSKLPVHTGIFNLTPATFCTGRDLGLCQLQCTNDCYALKAERQYKQVLPYRIRQSLYWDDCTIQDFINEFLKSGHHGVRYLRFNEAGEIRNQKDINKIVKIARILLVKYGITCYLYTCRKDLDFSELRKYCIINASGFDCFDNGVLPHHSFTAIEIPKDLKSAPYKEQFLHVSKSGFDWLCFGDCRKCNVCTKERHLKIAVIKH